MHKPAGYEFQRSRPADRNVCGPKRGLMNFLILLHGLPGKKRSVTPGIHSDHGVPLIFRLRCDYFTTIRPKILCSVRSSKRAFNFKWNTLTTNPTQLGSPANARSCERGKLIQHIYQPIMPRHKRGVWNMDVILELLLPVNPLSPTRTKVITTCPLPQFLLLWQVWTLIKASLSWKSEKTTWWFTFYVLTNTKTT